MGNEQTAIVVEARQGSFISPASLDAARDRYRVVSEFIKSILRESVDYGKVPGADKPCLKKPGAEKMASLFGLSPTFQDVQVVEDWTGKDHDGEPFFYYRIRCTLHLGERLIGSADGSCNSWEKKYRYRKGDRLCPKCGAAAIYCSKNKPEWYCWSKKGGCGATFHINDKAITDQEVGLVKNPDVADQVNTILKMAEKRALVAAVLIATNTSDYFTQDIEDYIEADYTPAPPPPAPAPTITVTEPIDVPDEPEHAMSYETACAITNRDGESYGSIQTAKLSYMLRSIEKRIKENHLEADELDSLQNKRDAIIVIIRHRREVGE